MTERGTVSYYQIKCNGNLFCGPDSNILALALNSSRPRGRKKEKGKNVKMMSTLYTPGYLNGHTGEKVPTSFVIVAWLDNRQDRTWFPRLENMETNDLDKSHWKEQNQTFLGRHLALDESHP